VVSGKSHPSTDVHKNCKIPNGGNHAQHVFLERFQRFFVCLPMVEFTTTGYCLQNYTNIIYPDLKNDALRFSLCG